MSDTPGKIYPQDRMTAAERLQAVVRLDKPDRVPLSLMLYYFAPLWAGVKMSLYMTRPDIYMDVMHRVWAGLGPWDIYYNINPVSRIIYSYVIMMRILWPGLELEENAMAKIEEFAYMDQEDYDRILSRNSLFSDFLFRLDMLPRFCREAQGLKPLKLTLKLIREYLQQLLFCHRDFSWWRRQGAVVQIGYQAEMPFDTMSQARNVINFSKDLFKCPDKIGKAAEKLANSFANLAILTARLTGVPLVQCYCHRTSNSFISPVQFEKLAFPSMEIIVNRIVDAGMTPILHCDGNWLKNLKFMRRLPARRIILQLDGLTDIFRAKEEIGDHMCLFGDVSAGRLVTGSPGEIEEYCHRLIEEVGKGGGFILAGGCEIPPNARFENLKAMVRAVRKYGYYEDSGTDKVTHYT